MARQFNTAVTCDPKRHYMVDTTNKMKVFERLINNGNYFTINRARQFGKSTSLKWIYTHLNGEYLVVSLSFEDTEDSDWENASTFYHFFCRYMENAFTSDDLTKNEQNAKFWEDAQKIETPSIKNLSDKITEFCQQGNKKVVVLIDEVDKSLDNELFLNFLAMLRKKYIDRDKQGDNSTFWSVVLAGVYDIKSMKVKIRPEEEHKYNSPWNVAADYKLDMTFNPQEISTMLADYESENHIGFDINEISQEIYKYTSGYPVLVSAVCKEIDENLDRDWTKEGVLEAVNNLIKDNSAMLFKDITKNIENNPDLKKLLRAISLENFKISYYADIFPVELGRLFSLLKADKHSCAQIHNLIFQQRINNYFIAENQFGRIESNAGPSVYTDKQGDLNMPLIINRFKDLMSKKTDKAEFLEREGRFMFICFLKPILNGTGFYYTEPENDDGSRMDLVITFNHKEYVVELKIWHGTEYELSGRDQLSEYLETRNLNEGYLVTFSFLKEKVVQEKPEWIEYNGKKIYEAVI